MDNAAVADVLERAADLITPEGAWTQGAMWRGKSGRPVSTKRAAVCFCAMGAIDAVVDKAYDFADMIYEAQKALYRAIGPIFIGDWNDSPTRTQTEVVAAFREAAALTRAEGE